MRDQESSRAVGGNTCKKLISVSIKNPSTTSVVQRRSWFATAEGHKGPHSLIALVRDVKFVV